MSSEPTQASALYVHLPYCVAKCHYCDFYSEVPPALAAPASARAETPAQDLDGQLASSLVDNLLLEAQLHGRCEPKTVFFGGGTPSMLPGPELERLLVGLDRLTGFGSSAREVTAECNPESLTEDKARLLLDLGVTRLSIGFQSLDPEVLKLFGRVHGPKQSIAALSAARAAGHTNVSADLIYGHPGDTPELWAKELSEVLELGPNHLSAYNLTYEEGTVFERWRRQGRLEKLDEELELGLFWATRETCTSYGFEAYEISNFAPKDLHCHHNINYWHNGTYLGLGPSAVSKIGLARRGNPRSTKRWGEAVEQGKDAWEWTDEPSALGRLAESWWLGLRLAEGIGPAAARAAANYTQPDPVGPDSPDPAETLAHELAQEGLLETFQVPEISDTPQEPRYRLTQRGLPLADAVATKFLQLSAPA